MMFKKITKRKEFIIIFAIMILAVLLNFLYECKVFSGLPLSGRISAFEGTILTNILDTPFNAVFGSLLPIVACVVASTIYLEDKQNDMESCIYTRISRKKYVWTQGYAIFLVVFGMILFSLFVSLILALCAFPFQGSTIMGTADYTKLGLVDKNYMLDDLYRCYPYTNIIIFIVLRALVGASFAWMAYGISFLPKMKKIMVLFAPFALQMGLELVTGFIRNSIQNEKIKIVLSTNILTVNHYGSFIMVLFLIGFYILLGGICIAQNSLEDQRNEII